MATLSLVFSLLMMAAGTADVTVVSLLRGEIALPMAPGGRAAMKREGTITRVRVDIDHLAPPSALGVAYNSYVVWSVSPEGTFENIGELFLEKDKGRFEATTRFEQVGLLITAEPHFMVDRPSSGVAFVTQSPRKEDVRTVTVSVPIGAYDYTSIQPNGAVGAPTLVVESRVSFQIAKNAQADRLAEPEFRRAKVALDTMEEMVNRSSPPEIVTQAANEVIRRSQQAVTTAREKESAVALENARGDIALLRQQIETLNARVQQMATEQTAANAQIQKLQNDAAAANRENQRVAQERDQAIARDRASSRALSDIQGRQDGVKNQLIVPLREEFYDPKSQSLTPAGREALARARGLAEAVPGAVELQGPASDAAFEAARQYLLQTGLPENRIILKR